MSKQQQSKEQKNYHEDFILNCLTQKLSFRKKIDLKHNQKNAFKNAQFVRYFAGYLKLKWPYIKLSYKQILCSYHLNKYKSQICTQSWKNDENCKNMINLISYLEQAQDCYYRNKYQKIFEVVHKRGLEIILLRIEMDQNLQGCFELLTCDKENTLEDAKQEQYLLQKNLRDLIQKNNNQNQQNSDSIEERQNCQKTNFQNMQQCELNKQLQSHVAIEKKPQNYDFNLELYKSKSNQISNLNLNISDHSFLKKLFKLDVYLNSGGEADIFANIHEQIAFRVIKIDNEFLNYNIQELLNIKQFEQDQHVFDFKSSYLIENKLKGQKYIIHTMQISHSLLSEFQIQEKFSISQILHITFDSLHFLILLRQKYIYHSDIKLGNIFKTHDQYRLADFGASKIIEINNPFTQPIMYTDSYRPKNNQQTPFYHDIYSFAKTIQIIIQKMYSHKTIQNRFQNLLYGFLKDDENSIQIDCFKLPQMFINCLIDSQDNNAEIQEFYKRYLPQIEQYIQIKKENKAFNYESQYQYAQIGLQILAEDQPIEVSFDKDTWELYLIIKNLYQQVDFKKFYNFKNIEVNIERLVQQYESLIPLDSRLTQDRILPYEEQYKYKSLQKHMSMKYENLQRSNTQKNYEFFNQIKFQETQIVVLKQMQLLLHQIQIDKNHSFKNQKFTFNDINKFFDCNTFSLKYIGTEEQFKTDIPTMSKVIHFKELVKKLSNQEFQKAFTQHDYNQVIIDTSKISILTIALQDQDETYFQIQNQTLFIILKKGIIKDFNSIAFSFFISYFSSLQTLMLNLKNDHNNCEFAQMLMKVMDNLNFKNIHLSMFDNKIGLEGCQKIANILQKNKSISQLSLKLVNNQISDEEINIIIEGLTNCQYLNSLNIDFSWNQIGNDGMKAILKVLKIFKRITHLYINLSSNKISDEGLEGKEKNEFKFCQYIVELSLNLKNNKISINGAQKIKSALEKNRKLAKFKLYLSGNYLDNQAIESLKEVLENFESCSEPYFDLFNIGNKGAQNIESEFEEANSNFDQLNQIEMFPIDFSQEKENIKSNQIINLNWDQIYSDTSQNIQEFLMKIKNCQLNIKISNFVNQNQCITSYQNIEDHLRQYTLSLVQVNKGENNQNIEKNYAFHLYLDIGILGYQEVSSIIANLKRHHRVYLYQNPCNQTSQYLYNENIWNSNNLNDNLHLNIDIHYNEAKIISNTLRKLLNFKQLSINLNKKNIDYIGVKSIEDSLINFKLTSLKLDLGLNNIEGRGAQSLANILQNNQSIKELNLNLNYNNIEQNGAQAISSGLKNCKQITQLSLLLGYNRICDMGVEEIVLALEFCSQINKLSLSLSANLINEQGASLLAQLLEKFQNMTTLILDLSINSLDRKTAQNIANNLDKCKNITNLTLDLTEQKSSYFKIYPALQDQCLFNLNFSCFSSLSLILNTKGSMV
ncbi:hypothetical protein ABPG74_019274 [Tetrahymena malaccensis]